MGRIEIKYIDDHSKMYLKIEKKFSDFLKVNPSKQELWNFSNLLEFNGNSVYSDDELKSIKIMIDYVCIKYRELFGKEIPPSKPPVGLGKNRVNHFCFIDDVDNFTFFSRGVERRVFWKRMLQGVIRGRISPDAFPA